MKNNNSNNKAMLKRINSQPELRPQANKKSANSLSATHLF